MSVTFSADQVVAGWMLECGCGQSKSAIAGSYAELDALRGGFVYTCDDAYCSAFPAMSVAVYAEQVESVNVSNVNARFLLGMLAFDAADLCGSVSADEFLGRVLVADGLSVGDAGVPAIQEGNMVECGRPEGYAEDSLAALRTLANSAKTLGVDIIWG